MRHNIIYISDAERSDGQTEKARSENAGVETDWRPQPSPRLCFRHFVPRESILRSERPSPGPLRDAAATQCGESLDRRCGYHVWRFAPNRLSGPGCIPASRPERLASQAPWTQRRAQAVRRSHRLCGGLTNCRARLDDCRLCPGRSGEVRYHGSPPQSGAGVGEQKKTAQSGVSAPIPEGTIEAYEGLRRQVVQSDGRGEHLEGRGILMRCGLATWAQSRLVAVPARPPESHFPSGLEAPVLDSFGAELVRLVAGLILSTRQEGFPHA